MRKILAGFLLLPLVLAGCGKSGDSLPIATTTIYYKPVIYLDKETCPASEKINVVDEEDQVLTALCKTSYYNCLMQGSCFVVDGEKKHNYNFTKKKDDINRFKEKHEARCPYGYGVKNICMDPFYSVAADPAYNKPGDVIYVPKVVGTQLPDGTQHTGYFVVRDEGGRIVGEHRFDFFTGFYGPYDSANAFSKLGLGNSDSKFGYQKVPEELAKKVREFRNYPNIP